MLKDTHASIATNPARLRFGRGRAAGRGRSAPPALRPHRSFDPVALGKLETDAWIHYYRREWLAFARSAITLSRRVFALSWPATIRCSWLVLRATQMWAPYPDNDPEGARRAMERFYTVIQAQSGDAFEPTRAAALEVQWWHIHRVNQHDAVGGDDRALADALARLYSHIYGVPEPELRGAAEQRAKAMRHSDQWVCEGCHLDSSLITRERYELIRSYTALLDAIRGASDPCVIRRRPGPATDGERQPERARAQLEPWR
jgi:hypothetical protein